MAEDDRSGEPIEASAKAVIIATGGFGDNPALIKKYTGYEYGKDLFSFRVPGLMGDGIRMAWEVGAAPSEISMELIFGIPGEEVYGWLVRGSFRQPNLMVNLLGERFMNEEVVMNTPFTGNAIARQKDRCGVMIYDDTTLRHYEKDGFDLPLSLVFDVPMEDIERAIKNAISAGIENLFIANSLEELASKAGIDPNGLKETVEEYNRYCEEGYDGLFNKDRKYLRSIKGPKFYAGKNYPGAYGSLGGIKINYKTEVLNKDWKKIPGLYAAGSDTCSIYGDTYPFILPGNTMGYALNSGRIAGENASAYVKSMV
jgi:fumarate reductase flavoprotein subunit